MLAELIRNEYKYSHSKNKPNTNTAFLKKNKKRQNGRTNYFIKLNTYYKIMYSVKKVMNKFKECIKTVATELAMLP